jgi:hypothetical protein
VSQAGAILTELQLRGVVVAAEGDTLCLKPKRVLDEELLSRVREAKPEILEVLRKRPSTCSRHCYEVEPGIWIHRPWTGCNIGKVAVTCWHCRGERECECSACWQGRPGECVTCKGTGQVWQWAQ